MAEKVPQTLANHVRLHPPFHFFLLPASAAALILGVINVIKHYETLEAWTLMVLCAMAPVATLLIRVNPLKAQDRLIRLEERMRLQALLQEPVRSKIGELN